MNQRNSPEYSLEAFSKIQTLLEEEGVAVDAGSLTPYSTYVPVPAGEWGRGSVPAAASGTYYYDSYLSGGSYILSTAESESIDTYAIRTRDLVETLRSRTGSDKVIIVAHSMGGLVARRYLQLFGEDHVARLILVATPNNGVNASIATFCPLFGADKECGEMSAGSSMLAKLNDPSRLPTVPVIMIVGLGCNTGGEDGDGVVTAASARLPWATDVEVPGNCSSFETLHTALLDPARYPTTYMIIKEAILSEESTG